MFIVRRIPLSNSKPLAELKKFNSGVLLPSVTRQPEYIMLNKGSHKKVTLICYRVGVMTFSLGALSRFLSHGPNILTMGCEPSWGEGSSLKTNDAAFPLKDCLIKMAAVFIPPSNQ